MDKKKQNQMDKKKQDPTKKTESQQSLEQQFLDAEDYGRRMAKDEHLDRETAAPQDNKFPGEFPKDKNVHRAEQDKITDLKEQIAALTRMLSLFQNGPQVFQRPQDLEEQYATVPHNPTQDGEDHVVEKDLDDPFSKSSKQMKPRIIGFGAPNHNAMNQSKVADFKNLLKMVPTFDGKSVAGLLKYVQSFELYLEDAQSCSDYVASQTFKHAVMRLTDDAYSEWSTVQETTKHGRH